MIQAEVRHEEICPKCGWHWYSRVEHTRVCPHCRKYLLAKHPHRNKFICKKCGNEWDSRLDHPSRCPKCNSYRWETFPFRKIRVRPPRQSEKRAGIVAAYGETPKPTLEQIGDRFGLTRERVRQILNSEGIDTHHQLKYVCKICGKHLLSDTKSRICQACHAKQTTVTLVCSGCGKEFPRRSRLIRYRAHNYGDVYTTDNVFCSKQCQGEYLARNFGFPAHPEHAGRQGGNSKYLALMPEAVKLAKEGLWLAEIGRRLHIERAIYRKDLLVIIRSQAEISLKPRKDRQPRRKYTYIQTIIPQAIELSKQGLTLYRIAGILNVGLCSLYRYRKEILGGV